MLTLETPEPKGYDPYNNCPDNSRIRQLRSEADANRWLAAALAADDFYNNCMRQQP